MNLKNTLEAVSNGPTQVYLLRVYNESGLLFAKAALPPQPFDKRAQKMWALTALLSTLLVPALADTQLTRNGQHYSCKCYPGDSCWPTTTKWNSLNSTVGGNLLVALPPAAPCHNTMEGIPTYNAAKCADVQANFATEQWT